MSPMSEDEWAEIVRDFQQGKSRAAAASAVARNSDPETSHAAARGVKVSKGQQQVYDLLKAIGPASDERAYELARQRGMVISPSGLRSRRSELVKQHGKVRDTGQRVKSSTSNNMAIVWEAL